MNIYKMTNEVLADVKPQSWMDTGIHENVELVEINVDTSKNGNPFIAFYFENDKGERASKTEWEVNAPKPMEQMDEKEKTLYLGRIRNQMTRISMIAKQFIDKNELLFEAPDFKSYITIIKNKLDGRYKGVKLRIKITYDYNDWATLPSYTKYTWIERMDLVPSNKSRIKIIMDMDKMVKDKPDTFKKEENVLLESSTDSSTTSATANVNGLPF